MSSLLSIANKAPIVSTFGAEALRESPIEVREAYDWHAATYVEQGPLAELRRSFIKAVRESQSPKACLVAPFGYGKTASAIGMWRACQAANHFAIPPISCGSFTEIARAIYDWLVFTLPEHRDDIAAAHDQFLANSAEALARRDERQFGIPLDQGLAAIKDKMEKGYLDFEDISVNLLSFIETITALILKIGYDGLVVIIDEMQQLIGNANKGVLVALRQLIWGLRTHKLPFGLLITMDPDTERTLVDRAGDIVHRIKDDGLYLDIRNIYDRTFPARLWNQYVTAFDLSSDVSQSIDCHALDALGQLCERDDLSNGPRTVINVLQIAAARWKPGDAGYSPIDLVDNFVSGTIHFDGDRAVLPALVRELVNYPYFQRSPERTRGLKLIAAFPRGCSVDAARIYALEDAWQELSDDLRGEILTELDEGLALIELQRVGRPANQLNLLLRRYWMQITDQQLFAEDAPRAFSELVLPLLFPSKLNDLNGWLVVRDVQLTADGGYAGILEGTSSPSYPLRRIAVAIVSVGQDYPTIRGMSDVDLHIIFRLNLDPSAVSSVIVNPVAGSIELKLALAHRVEGGLRGGLSWIEHYLSPQPISAAVVLSLLRYFSHEGVDEIASRDQARIEDTIARLRTWLLTELMPPELFNSCGIDVVQAGYGGMHEFLYLVASSRWPGYQTIVMHQHWATLMSDYLEALTRVPPAVRAGIVAFSTSKVDLATLFGQARHAGFESRAKQYGSLLKLEVWRGDEAVVRFVPHPMELRLAAELRTSGPISEEAVYRQLRGVGFAAAEVDMLLELAQARGLVTEDAGMLAAPIAPAGAELVARARSLMQRCSSQANVPAEFRVLLLALLQDSNQQTDSIEAAWKLDRIDQWVTQAEAQALAEEKARAQEARKRLIELLPRLHPLPLPEPTGELTNHIAAIRRLLDEERRQLETTANTLVEMDRECPADEADAVSLRIASWSERAELYQRWYNVAHDALSLLLSFERLDAAESLAHLECRTQDLVRNMRSVLAQVGVAALPDIGRFEAAVSTIKSEYSLARDEREQAYTKVATSLFHNIANLVGSPVPPVFPAYEADDDAHSFDHLRNVAAASISRALALSALEIMNEGGSRREKLARAKLRSDIRALARRCADPSWIIVGTHPTINNGAVKSIRAIQERLAREADSRTDQASFSAPHVVAALSALPPGPADLSMIFDRLKGRLGFEAIWAEITHLQEIGAVRLLIEVPTVSEDTLEQ